MNKTNYDIIYIDISDAALKRAQKEIKDYVSGLVDGGRILTEQANSYLKRVKFTKDYSVLKDAQIVWEIATENVDIKQKIFEQIEQNVDIEKLLFVFSNTSSHTTAELAELFKNR